MRRLGHWQRRANARSVISEAREVVEGAARSRRYAGVMHAPAWVYVNQLAHAQPAELVRLANQGWSEYRYDMDDASAYLASELLACGGGSPPLVEVQRALIPFELDLLGDDHPPLATPSLLVGGVLHALTTAGFGRAGW